MGGGCRDQLCGRNAGDKTVNNQRLTPQMGVLRPQSDSRFESQTLSKEEIWGSSHVTLQPPWTMLGRVPTGRQRGRWGERGRRGPLLTAAHTPFLPTLEGRGLQRSWRGLGSPDTPGGWLETPRRATRASLLCPLPSRRCHEVSGHPALRGPQRPSRRGVGVEGRHLRERASHPHPFCDCGRPRSLHWTQVEKPSLNFPEEEGSQRSSG